MTTSLEASVARLTDPSIDVRTAGAEELARLGDGAQPAAVALLDACGDVDAGVREWVAAALEGLGLPRPEDCNAFVKRLGTENPAVAYWAATLLGRLQSDAKAAVGPLSLSLTSHTSLEVRQRVAWALGKIGPEASAAAPALKEAARSSDARLARLAKQALTEIGAN